MVFGVHEAGVFTEETLCPFAPDARLHERHNLSALVALTDELLEFLGNFARDADVLAYHVGHKSHSSGI